MSRRIFYPAKCSDGSRVIQINDALNPVKADVRLFISDAFPFVSLVGEILLFLKSGRSASTKKVKFLHPIRRYINYEKS